MKRLNTLLLVAALLFSTQLFAQTAVNAYWDLGTDSHVDITGGNSLEADTVFWSPALILKDYTGGAISGPALRLNATDGWPGSETWIVDNRWIQFLVKPASGNMLHVDSISFWLGAYGTHGGMHANVYWDTDTANFSYNNLLDLDSSSAGLPDVRDRDQHDTSFVINTDVNDGGLFAFRVYPWYSVTSPSTSKYVVMWIVYVYGTTSPATGVEDQAGVPKKFMLEQNYPNPFNPSTNISFDMPKQSHVSLDVYNLLGQKVATLVDGEMGVGSHTVNFDAANLSSGIYFYKLSTDNFTSIKKMTLLK